MPETLQTSRLQQAINTVESLSIKEQNLVVDIFLKRLQRKRREQLLQEISEIQQEVSEGKIKYGSVDDFLKELDSWGKLVGLPNPYELTQSENAIILLNLGKHDDVY